MRSFAQINGQDISWQHLVSLYNEHKGKGLTIQKKLKWEHIKLTSYSKMRVDLAAQVQIISFSVSYTVWMNHCRFSVKLLLMD